MGFELTTVSLLVFVLWVEVKGMKLLHLRGWIKPCTNILHSFKIFPHLYTNRSIFNAEWFQVKEVIFIIHISKGTPTCSDTWHHTVDRIQSTHRSILNSGKCHAWQEVCYQQLLKRLHGLNVWKKLVEPSWGFMSINNIFSPSTVNGIYRLWNHNTLYRPTVVHGKCSWWPSSLDGLPPILGRNSSHDPAAIKNKIS